MTQTSSSRWGAQLVMWSSPVLLLVMLFSMTTSARAQRSPHVSVEVAPTTSPASIPTTTSLAPASTTSTLRRAPRTPPASTKPSRPATHATNFSAATASNESSSGSGVGASVSNGVVAGVLAGGQVVDVPLNGPGTWEIWASAPVATRLVCPRANTSFADLVVIDRSQTCQLLITASTTSATSWRLAPRS